MQPTYDYRALAYRFFIALASGVIVAGLCLFLVADGAGARYIRFPQVATAKRLKTLDESVEAFKHRYGRLPVSLAEACPDPGVGIHGEPITDDDWFNPIIYAAKGNHYSLTSYGADGKPGGTGLACDLSNQNPNPREATPSPWDYLRTPLSQGMVMVGLMCGCAVACFTFFTTDSQSLAYEQRYLTFIRLFLTLIAAAYASVAITMLHVPSGH